MTVKRRTLILAILGTLALAGLSAWAQQFTGTGTATLSWQRPTERVDGTPLPIDQIAGYVIWYGTESRFGRCPGDQPADANDTGCYPTVVSVTNGGVASRELSFELDGPVTLYFAMAAIDTGGRISSYSNEASKTFELEIDEAGPEPPQLLDVEISISCEASEPGVTCTFVVQ